MRSLAGVLLVPAMLLAGAFSGCAANAPVEIKLAQEVQKPSLAHPAAVVFFIDGLSYEKLWELQRQGKLPNITRHFLDSGVRVENAAVSLPTITSANSVSIVTAMYPGHHGITGNKWFDPDRLIYQDYTVIKAYQRVDQDFTAPTIYEMLGEDFTATMTVAVRRGATRPFDNWMSTGISWFFGMTGTVNSLPVIRLPQLGKISNSVGRWPILVLSYFPTPDTIGHKDGPDAASYNQAMEDVDKRIGLFLQSLRNAGLYDCTYRVLLSDHGFMAVDLTGCVDVGRFVRQDLGIPAKFHAFGWGESMEKQQEHFGAARAVVVTEGVRMVKLHLRAGDYWYRRPSADQIDNFARQFGLPRKMSPELREKVSQLTFPQLLAQLPCVDLLAMREGPDTIRVLDTQGVARITRQVDQAGKRYRYEVISGRDPLAHTRTPATAELMDGAFHSAQDWMVASLDTPHPDVVPQLPEMFDSPRTGDVVLFAKDNCGFSQREQTESIENWAGLSLRRILGMEQAERGGHGGLTRQEIYVPFLWAGPGLPAGGVIPMAHTADLTPTLLNLLGKSQRFRTLGPADGRDISTLLRAAIVRPVQAMDKN